MDQSRKLYIFGGHDGRRSLADLHIFDTESMNWSKAAVSGRPPVAGSRHTTTLAGDKLYVLGASDSGTFRDVHALDIETLTWSPVEAGGQPPIARSRHTSTLVGRNLVVFGGVGGGRPLNDLYVMHAGSLFWTEPPVNGIAPTQRVGHTATLVGTKVFIFGGHDGRVCLNDVHILVTMNWRAVNTKGGRPTPRVSCTMNTVGGKLFLLGGGAGEKAFNDVRVLDLESAVWTVPTVSGTPPAALVGHTSTLIGTELFVFGGSDGKSDGNELHMFDTETLSWSLPSLEGQPPMARVGHSGSAVGATKIYYFGGYGVRLGYVSDTYVLDTALLSWTKPYINGTPPPARIGHASVVIGTKLYVFAGANAGFVLQDMHVLDTTSMSWIEPPTGGLAPGPLFGHTAQPVGRCRSLHACHPLPRRRPLRAAPPSAAHARTLSRQVHLRLRGLLGHREPRWAHVHGLGARADQQHDLRARRGHALVVQAQRGRGDALPSLSARLRHRRLADVLLRRLRWRRRPLRARHGHHGREQERPRPEQAAAGGARGGRRQRPGQRADHVAGGARPRQVHARLHSAGARLRHAGGWA